MPLLVVAIAFIAVAIVFVALLPVTLVQRYRVGTRRQRARPWLLTLNVVGLFVSAALFLSSAAITTLWVPYALSYSAAGFSAGALLGLLSLWMTRWEPSSAGLHFTPNRWLVMGIMLVVGVRLAYGFWRAWHAWEGVAGRAEWVAAAGIPESMAAGGLALGYYLVYWTGVRRTLSTHGLR